MKRNKDKVTVNTKGEKVFSKAAKKVGGMRPEYNHGLYNADPIYFPKKGKK